MKARWLITVGAMFTFMALAAPAQAAPTSTSVHYFTDASVVPAATSTLQSNAAGARMNLRTSGLQPGHGVTIWWVIFNEPGNCVDGSGLNGARCGEHDLPPFGGDDSAVTSVLYAAGHVIGGKGTANFSGHLSTGDDGGALWGPGLVNPTDAEIHLVVRDHGRRAPGGTDDSIHTFGWCNGGCTDVQFAIHVQ